MFGRTNRLSEGLTRRQKHVMATVGGLVLLAFVGLGIWGALVHDSYSQSANGCVNVTVPGSTGGATLHYCGSAARAFCHSALAGHDQISLRARPQCRLAGLLPRLAEGTVAAGAQVPLVPVHHEVPDHDQMRAAVVRECEADRLLAGNMWPSRISGSHHERAGTSIATKVPA